jgi:hypothetical protein
MNLVRVLRAWRNGRRGGLKIRYRKVWGFDSLRSHPRQEGHEDDGLGREWLSDG